MGASSKFPALFRELEQRKDELRIDNYGIGVTTLEEVFLKVAEESEEEAARLKEEALHAASKNLAGTATAAGVGGGMFAAVGGALGLAEGGGSAVNYARGDMVRDSGYNAPS